MHSRQRNALAKDIMAIPPTPEWGMSLGYERRPECTPEKGPLQGLGIVIKCAFI